MDSKYFQHIVDKKISYTHYIDINRMLRKNWYDNGGLISNRTKWIWAMILMRSEFPRHRKTGVAIIETFHDENEPATPFMMFQLALARIRTGQYGVAMDMMKSSREFYKGYEKNVALEKYLHVKIQERMWHRRVKMMFQCMIIGTAVYFGCKICQLDFQYPWTNEGPPLIPYIKDEYMRVQ